MRITQTYGLLHSMVIYYLMSKNQQSFLNFEQKSCEWELDNHVHKPDICFEAYLDKIYNNGEDMVKCIFRR